MLMPSMMTTLVDAAAENDTDDDSKKKPPTAVIIVVVVVLMTIVSETLSVSMKFVVAKVVAVETLFADPSSSQLS